MKGRYDWNLTRADSEALMTGSHCSRHSLWMHSVIDRDTGEAMDGSLKDMDFD